MPLGGSADATVPRGRVTPQQKPAIYIWIRDGWQGICVTRRTIAAFAARLPGCPAPGQACIQTAKVAVMGSTEWAS